MLCGTDPHRYLTTTDVVEVALTRRAIERAAVLRHEDRQEQAVLVVQCLAEALKKKS